VPTHIRYTVGGAAHHKIEDKVHGLANKANPFPILPIQTDRKGNSF